MLKTLHVSLSRRRFLTSAAPLPLAPLLVRCAGTEPVFEHGVASGDPLPDAVILWTRVTTAGDGPVSVHYRVATDAAMQNVVQQGEVQTSSAEDFTVKVDARALPAGRTHYYQFEAVGQRSPIGRTRTLPDGHVAGLTLAVASCSNMAFGYFNAYRQIANREDVDLVLHLGDYLYEYENGAFGDGSALGRAPLPDREALTLDDYRRRHAQYKSDPDLREAHRRHPFLTVWDDHELANDAYGDGAQNHQPATEGDWELRKSAAIRAYHEWMPIRTAEPDRFERIYRHFPLGDLADLMLLDTRIIGRDAPAADPCDREELAVDRQLLGEEQQAWLSARLEASREQARWKLIGQQIMMGQLVNVLETPACIFNPDQWDGYPQSRARLLAELRENGHDNVLVLTGDIHSSWANEITEDPFNPALYDAATGRGSLAVELVTPGITSPGVPDPAQAAQLQALLAATHPHVKHADLTRRGYLSVTLTHDRALARWHHVAALDEPNAAEVPGASVQILDGESRAEVLDPDAP